MKVLRKDEGSCTGCGACVAACAKLWHKTEDPEKSCIKIAKGENGNTITVCTQCGECVPVCPGVALDRDKNGVVKLDKKRCVGCFICVGFCPELAMMTHPDYIEPFKCTACGSCVKACPSGALRLETVE